jgi:hypothetical protein
VQVHTITGAHPGVVNTFTDPHQVTTTTRSSRFGPGPVFATEVPPHSITAFGFTL